MTTDDQIKTLKDIAKHFGSRAISEMIDDIELKLKFADAVIEETGVDIKNNEIEHQCGTVFVGNISITGIEAEEI